MSEITEGTRTILSDTYFVSSAHFGKLTEALAKAAANFGKVLKDTENPYFRSQYASLDSLIHATRPALSDNGLAIIQLAEHSEKGAGVRTILSHTSGEWISSFLCLPATKQDAQGLGSAITYARRYAYQSILNIAGEEDDDGNAAVGKTQEDRRSSSTDESAGFINPVQIRAFQSACQSSGRTEKQIADFLETLGRSSVEEIAKGAEYQTAIKWALNKGQDVEASLKASLSLAKKRNGKDEGVFTMCNTHGKYSGEGNCPKCETA